MSIIDKAIAALTPPESEEQRRDATEKARSAASPGDWLSMALDHHEQIREAFDDVRAAQGAARMVAFKKLATILNGHSLAEEIVLYPGLSDAGETGHANMAYTEQTATKMQMAALEKLDPSSEEWMDKFEHVRGAVLHHMYEEEDNWFLDLKSQSPDQSMLTARFKEEFERYVGDDLKSGVMAPGGMSPGASSSDGLSSGSGMGTGMGGMSTGAGAGAGAGAVSSGSGMGGSDDGGMSSHDGMGGSGLGQGSGGGSSGSGSFGSGGSGSDGLDDDPGARSGARDGSGMGVGSTGTMGGMSSGSSVGGGGMPGAPGSDPSGIGSRRDV
jgi:hypothetical protein